VHKPECLMLRKVKPRVPGPTMRLLARLLRQVGGRHEADAEAEDHAWARGIGGVLSLVHLLPQQPSERRLAFDGQATMLCALLAEASDEPPPPPSLAAEMLSRLSLNCHTLCDDELHDYGIGIYPLAALANHHCDPSAVQMFDKHGVVTFRALRNLRAGESITIAYVELAESTVSRQSALRLAYLFHCACERCTLSAVSAAAAREEQDVSEAFRQSRDAELDAIDRQAWTEARELSCRSCTLASRCYPRHSPALGLQFLRTGKLHAHCGHALDAMEALQGALSILEVTHGPASDLVQSAAAMLQDVRLEVAYGSGPQCP